MASLLTHARLRELLDYDPETGHFTWRASGKGRPGAGMIAGYVMNKGYRLICVDYENYLAGRLAVFYMTGEWPPEDTDHINGIRDDNRWSNLRLASRFQNNGNSRAKGKFLPKGVTWDKRNGRFQAQIKINYRTIFLGRFDTAEEAHAAYVAAAQRYFGNFARAR